VTRAFAVYFVVGAVIEATYVPVRWISFSHDWAQPGLMSAQQNDLIAYSGTELGLLIVRIVAYAVAAAVFWRCGPRIEALFSPPPPAPEDALEK
jgi:hypothetical protein